MFRGLLLAVEAAVLNFSPITASYGRILPRIDAEGEGDARRQAP